MNETKEELKKEKSKESEWPPQFKRKRISPKGSFGKPFSIMNQRKKYLEDVI